MSTENFKAQAARLVKYLSEQHKFRLKQSSSLEAIAAIHGMRNWNTLINCPPSLSNLPAEHSTTPPGSGAVAQSVAPSFDAWWTRWMPASQVSLSLPAPGHGARARDAVRKEAVAVETVPLPSVEEVIALVASRATGFVGDVNPFVCDTTDLVNRVGWRKGNRLYLLEIRLRQGVIAQLPEGAQLAVRQPRRGLHPVTLGLLRAWNAQGWLVTEWGGARVDPDFALWNVQVGKYPYKGVIVLDLPDIVSNCLGAKDTRYPVEILEPLYSESMLARMRHISA